MATEHLASGGNCRSALSGRTVGRAAPRLDVNFKLRRRGIRPSLGVKSFAYYLKSAGLFRQLLPRSQRFSRLQTPDLTLSGAVGHALFGAIHGPGLQYVIDFGADCTVSLATGQVLRITAPS